MVSVIDGIRKRVEVTMQMRLASLVLLVIVLQAPAARGSTIVKRSFDELCARADLVFNGTVTAVETRRHPESGVLYTYTTFAGVEWIHGGDGGASYTVRTRGGTVDGESVVVHGMPRFDVGKQYIVFLRGNERLVCPVVGWRQGCFHVRRESADQQPCVLTYDGNLVLRIRNGEVVASGQNGEAIPLDRFLDEIRAGVARAAQASGGNQTP